MRRWVRRRFSSGERPRTGDPRKRTPHATRCGARNEVGLASDGNIGHSDIGTHLIDRPPGRIQIGFIRVVRVTECLDHRLGIGQQRLGITVNDPMVLVGNRRVGIEIRGFLNIFAQKYPVGEPPSAIDA